MFEKERAEIRVLSNIADAQGMSHARDLLRSAEFEFACRSDVLESMNNYCGKPTYELAEQAEPGKSSD